MHNPRRVASELQDFVTDPIDGIRLIEIVNLKLWHIEISKFPLEECENKKFIIRVVFPTDYPFKNIQVIF